MRPVATSDLSETLKRATHDLHVAVERSAMMRSLVHGDISLVRYCLLLRNLREIYAFIEVRLSSPPDEGLAALIEPALLRHRAIEADLFELHGPRWPSELPIVSPTREYLRRLEVIARDAPHRLLAHAYVRYMGDLHGGQILKRSLMKRLVLEEGVGTSFYDFGTNEEVDRLISTFRDVLNRLVVLPEMEADVVDEALRAFDLHRLISIEIAAAVVTGSAVPAAACSTESATGQP